MRRPRSITTLGAVQPGDHVCWPTRPDEDFDAAASAFIADAARSDDKVLILGPGGTARDGGPGVLILNVGTGPARLTAEEIAPLVRQETRTAGGQGFRALRVLARMEYVWPGAAGPDAVVSGDVARHELDLDAVVADGRALMVCSYRTDRFRPEVLRLAKGVHPQHLGTGTSVGPDFRMFSQGPDCWSVSGVVDSEGAEAFGIAVRELAARSPILRLRCEELELIDAAGMRALASAAGARPAGRVILSGAGATLRRAWTLLGLDAVCPQVEMEP